MQLKSIFSPNVRDAWRILQGKPLKYTASASPVLPAVSPLLPALSNADIAFFSNAIDSTKLSEGDLLVIGGRDPRVVAALTCLKTKNQQLKILPGWNAKSMDASIASMLPVWELAEGVQCCHDNAKQYLMNISKKPPFLIVVNDAMTTNELSNLLDLASKIGVKDVIGSGYGIREHETMRTIHQYRSVEAADTLWKISLQDGKISDQSAGKVVTPQTTTAPANTSDLDLVSIIVPTYDSRKYIGEALDDVALQTHRNWELIVVEDASPESVLDFIQAFQRRVPNNRVVFHRKATNSGASSTRNVAMTLAKGKFIAFLDSDDRWLPNHLKRKIEFLNDTPADIAYSAVDMFDHDTGRSLYDWGPDQQELEFFPDSLFIRNFIQPSGVVLRRDVIDDIGNFDESIFLVEDYDLWLRAIRSGKKFVYDPSITTRYRKNHAGASTTGRMVLCYDGVARVAMRNGDLLKDEHLRKYLLSRHLVTAGLGHLGHRKSSQNRCDPRIGHELIQAACELDESLWNARYWSNFAKFAARSGTTLLFRELFRKQFKKCCQSQVRLRSFRQAA
jgi:glycosyltransferase involved in cell wall biosynthesis